MSRTVRFAALLTLALLLPVGAGAVNGKANPPRSPQDESSEALRTTPHTSYYGEAIEGRSWRATAESALPSRLHLVDAEAFIRYRPVREGLRDAEWEVRVHELRRNHESIDAVYDMVLVLPLPEDAAGRDGFVALDDGITLYEGDAADAAPVIYGGREVVLRRNLGLERSLLPGLVGGTASEGRLPSLAGSGYRYTAWDAVIARDPDHGAVVQGSASLRYQVPGRIPGPDADDERLAAYVVTWIPTLSAEIAPYAVRLDVRD